MFNQNKSQASWQTYLWLLVILAIVAVIRVRLLDMPLERDEGEYAYAAQILLQGESPYKHAYTIALKLPGTCVMYAMAMAAFGETPAALHGTVLLINMVTALLIFVLARRIYGDTGGLIAAGTFAVLSVVPVTLGLAAHATHFVMLPAMAGIILLQKLDGNSSMARIFLAGFCFGLATLMKQTGAMFGFFAVSWIVWWEISNSGKQWIRAIKRLIWLTLGGMLPLLAMVLIIKGTGDFPRFWFWSVQYASAHGNVFVLSRGIQSMFVSLWQQFTAAPGFWSIAFVGFVLLFIENSLRRWRFFVASFAIFSFLAVCPGWYFRGHYFIQLLPAIGLLVAAASFGLSAFFARNSFRWPVFSVAIVGVAMVSAFIQWNEIFFRLSLMQATRAIYLCSAFSEAAEISRYLTANSHSDSQIFVMGSEPEIYFYSHRRSVTGYICTYELLEPQPYATNMLHEMIAEVEKARPEYVVYVKDPGSWFETTYHGNLSVFDWFDDYQREHLKMVGFVEIFSDAPTQYHWFNQEIPDIKTAADTWIAIYKQKTTMSVSTNSSAPLPYSVTMGR